MHHPPRNNKIKAQRVVKLFAKDQESLDRLLAQFSAQHHRGILVRLRPHLPFEPNPLPPPPES